MSATLASQFTCPICGRASGDARDIEQRFCEVHGFVDEALADPDRRRDLMAHRDLAHLCRPSMPDRNGEFTVETFNRRCRLTMRWLSAPGQWADWEGNVYTPKAMVALGFRCIEERVDA